MSVIVLGARRFSTGQLNYCVVCWVGLLGVLLDVLLGLDASASASEGERVAEWAEDL